MYLQIFRRKSFCLKSLFRSCRHPSYKPLSLYLFIYLMVYNNYLTGSNVVLFTYKPKETSIVWLETYPVWKLRVWSQFEFCRGFISATSSCLPTAARHGIGLSGDTRLPCPTPANNNIRNTRHFSPETDGSELGSTSCLWRGPRRTVTRFWENCF